MPLKDKYYSFTDSFNKYLSGYHMPGNISGVGKSISGLYDIFDGKTGFNLHKFILYTSSATV